MSIYSFLTLFGGLAFFLYGMHVMSSSLEKLSGGKLEKTLKKMTSNPFKSLALGAGITIAIQSSSAATVMLVGLVNSGIMELEQTIGIIMGSNIGTTLTAWLLSLTGISSDNVFVNMLKPANFSPIVAVIGILLIMASKKQRRKDVGSILLGFSVLMYGMELMSSSVSPLADSPAFSNFLVAFNNPILGILVGTVFTGIIQSSAASIGILQALSMTGSISYGMAIPIIMGQNIGTCATALLSAIGVKRNARRVAVLHLGIKIIGTIICSILFYSANAIFGFSFVNSPINTVGIALCHTVFNVLNTVLLMPFSRQLIWLVKRLIPDARDTESGVFLDTRLLNSPSFAIAECSNLTTDMAVKAQTNTLKALSLFRSWDQSVVDEVFHLEDELDHYEDELGTFLVQIASRTLSDSDSRTVSKLLHTIGNLERIGDHALNLQESALEMHEKELHFSAAASEELDVIVSALTEILDMAVRSFASGDAELASHVEPLEEVIDQLVESARMRHIARLKRGECTIELGFVLSDILNNIERISDQCSNVAVCIIETQKNSFDTHSYLHDVKASASSGFGEEFNKYVSKYTLP